MQPTLFSVFAMILMSLFSCTVSEKAPIKNKTMDEKTVDNRTIISAPIVKKAFVGKGKSNDLNVHEWYVERSVQDYFIKFCESTVTQKELESALEKEEDDFIKVLKLEVEFKQGNWDSCPEDEFQVQSRTGEYVVVHKIIN